MKKVWMKPIPIGVCLAVSLALLVATFILMIGAMVHYDGLAGKTRSAIHELAHKSKSDPAEVGRLLQEASDRLKRGESPTVAVGSILEINRR